MHKAQICQYLQIKFVLQVFYLQVERQYFQKLYLQN